MHLGWRGFLPGELANTIAHEEYHFENPIETIFFHSHAYRVGDACAGAI